MDILICIPFLIAKKNTSDNTFLLNGSIGDINIIKNDGPKEGMTRAITFGKKGE